jgi:hypothetical protein
MARAAGVAWHPEGNNKKTSIGRKNVKMSSMPKRKKATFKKYRGQGK